MSEKTYRQDALYNRALHWPPGVSVTGLAVGCSALPWQGPRQILAPVS